MAVYSNGIFSSGVDVLFENGESAVHAAVLNGGTMRVGKDGTAESVVLASGGRLTVFSGGTAKKASARTMNNTFLIFSLSIKNHPIRG